MRLRLPLLLPASLAMSLSCGSASGPAGPSAPPLAACAGDPALPARPLLQSPAPEAELTDDSPTFTVQNARGFDCAQASYTFRVAVAATDVEVGTVTVPAAAGATSARLPGPLLRGTRLAWRVTARLAGAEAASDSAAFRPPAPECERFRSGFARAVVAVSIPACSLAQNGYNDPAEVLGPPDAGRMGTSAFRGFLSLGDGGQVTVDMEACAGDGPGPDVRVYQSVSAEPVTLFASNSPDGPFLLLESRKVCADSSRPTYFSNHCDFDLAAAGLEQARYFRIQDGELYPCPGSTDTEGADIDAIEILNR